MDVVFFFFLEVLMICVCVDFNILFDGFVMMID